MSTLGLKRILSAVAVSLLTILVGCTPPSSNGPIPFEFNAVSDALPGSAVTSNEVSLAGFSGSLGATVTPGGELVINGVGQGAAAPVVAGDTLAVRVTASTEPNETVVATVTVGTFEADFSVTTREAGALVVSLETVPVGLSEATPGQEITLTWSVDSGEYDSLTLTTIPATVSTPVTAAEFAVTIPNGFPQITYVLTATDSETEIEGSASVALDVPLWVCQNPEDVITFADSELRANFSQFFPPGPTDEITCGDALAVTAWNTGHHIDAPGTIESLVGMQHFANLVQFNAHWNLVSDLAPLSGLDALEELNLDKNQVVDLSPLAGHPGLRILEVWDNGPTRDDHLDGITDLSPLASIPTLEQLFLSENNISDLSPLSGLTSLNVIYLIANDIEDISPLAGITGLQVLRLSGNRIEDASVLANMPAMGWLELDNNFLQDPAIVPLEDFDNLWVVSLEGNYFTSFDPLIDNVDFPAAGGVPGLPEHRGQPDVATVHIAYNCLTEAEDLAAGLAFEAKGLVVDEGPGGGPRIVRDQVDCDAVIGGAGEFNPIEMQQEAIQRLREQGRIR